MKLRSSTHHLESDFRPSKSRISSDVNDIENDNLLSRRSLLRRHKTSFSLEPQGRQGNSQRHSLAMDRRFGPSKRAPTSDPAREHAGLSANRIGSKFARTAGSALPRQNRLMDLFSGPESEPYAYLEPSEPAQGTVAEYLAVVRPR
jgi:hypothetical protein